MNKEDFYVGQKIKLPQDYYDYHIECHGLELIEYAEVTSLESLHKNGIIHFKIDLKGIGRIHSGMHYTEIQKYEHYN